MRLFRLSACVILAHLLALILLGRNHTLKKEPPSPRKVAVQTISMQPKPPPPPSSPSPQPTQPEPQPTQPEPQPEPETQPEPQAKPEPQPQPQTPPQPQKIPAAPATPKAPAKKPQTTKPSPPKKGAPKKTPKKGTSPQQKNQKALLSLAKSALSELETTASKGLPQLRTTSQPIVEVHEVSYSDLIISYLQDQLTLPESGEVKLRLTVKREGKITSHTILFSTENNRAYIEKALTAIVLPAFGSRFKGEKSHTFSITLTTLSD